MRDILVGLIQLTGFALVIAGSFLIAPPVGIAVSGLALLAIGWALDRE